MASLDQVRRFYAEELRHVAPAHSPLIVEAFATVPRECFLDPGPWRILPGRDGEAWMTEDDDPRHLYHNVLIPIDGTRQLNNGEPRLWAFLYDQIDLKPGEHVVHVGAGTGYYSAILSEIVGRSGRLTAIEVDPGLAARSSANLEPWRQATVVASDGFAYRSDPADAIIVNAGVSGLSVAWLDALKDGGRLLVPMTRSNGWGSFLLIERRGPDYPVRHVCRTGIFPCVGGRDSKTETVLKDVLRRRRMTSIRSLRRPPEPPDETCWLADEGYWLSTAPPKRFNA